MNPTIRTLLTSAHALATLPAFGQSPQPAAAPPHTGPLTLAGLASPILDGPVIDTSAPAKQE